MSLRLGIDARAATEEGAGGGRVERELLRALAERDDDHRYVLYARRPWDVSLDERFSWRLVRSRDPIWHLRVAARANRECDAFLSTNSYLTTWFLRVPSATMVFDLVAFDASLRPQRRSGLIERATLPLAVRRTRSLLAISRATAESLASRFPAARDKIEVVPLAASTALAEAREVRPGGVPEQGFVLTVGTLEPRKNLPRLVDAYRSLPAPLQSAHPLVVAGRVGWDASETLESLRALGPLAIQTGFVPDAQLAWLYRHCTLFAYPSLGEGFGLPVLEAMTAGAPVLTSDRSSLPEVGGPAVATCDPTDVAAISAALEGLLQDQARRQSLAAAGRARAAGFSWEKTAGLVLAAMERVSDARSRP